MFEDIRSRSGDKYSVKMTILLLMSAGWYLLLLITFITCTRKAWGGYELVLIIYLWKASDGNR